MALYIKVRTSTSDLRQRCRDAVLRDDRDEALKGGATEDHIHVLPWPLKHAVVACENTSTGALLAVGQTKSLRAGGDTFTVVLPFGPRELETFCRDAANGRVQFVFSYSYKGATTYSGTVDSKGVRNMNLAARDHLRSAQRDGKEPIFQAEANEAVRRVCISVQESMRVGHRDLLPLLKIPDLTGKVFADDGQIVLAELKKGDEATAAMIAAYLKPHLEQIRETSGLDKKDITVHEDQSSTSTTTTPPVASIGATIPLPIPFSLGLSKSLGDPETVGRAVVDRVEKATGSTWAYDKATERFRPHSIRKLKLANGTDQVLIDQTNTVFLSVGAGNRYLEDTPIPATFTTKATVVPAGATRNDDLGPYNGVPLGAMLPLFGTTPPKGYVWADGRASFPNADWVPGHLRGGRCRVCWGI